MCTASFCCTYSLSCRPQDYGLSTNYVPQELIKQFFAYWWATPLGSPERKRIKFAIKRGVL
jgi:hypothetical protein